MSLLELMIAATLSLFILAMVYNLYFRVVGAVKNAYAILDALENGRFAAIFLYNQIRNAQNISVLPIKMPANFVPGTDYLALAKTVYYIGNTHRKKSANNIYSLYMKKGTSPVEEVVEGVNNLKISYGIACYHSPNICWYVGRSDIKKVHLIRAVKCQLSFNDRQKWLVYVRMRNKTEK